MGFGRLSILIGLSLAASAGAYSLDEANLKVGGYVDNGRFQLKNVDQDGEIISRMGAKWAIDQQFDDHWSAMANLHWLFWRNQATDRGLFHIAGLKFDSDVQGSLAYESGANYIRAGLYDFKYNPDSKNLGEYLLRSEAYPTLLESSQGNDLLADSHTRVMGTQYDLRYALFRQTALLYSEQYNVPVNDVSAAYLAAVGPKEMELELGVAYHRALRFGKPINNSVLAKDLRDYVDKEGLTAKAFKFSLRGRLDVAQLLGWNADFKLYGEAALLGLKNDSLYYRNSTVHPLGVINLTGPFQRLPMMLGVDVPTMGLLSTLSLEVEYFKNPYLEREYPIADVSGNNFSPLPFIDDYASERLPNFSKDDMRWSVLAHKSLNRWVDLRLRMASDHLRLRNWNGDYEGGSPFTKSTRDWYFLARIEYHN